MQDHAAEKAQDESSSLQSREPIVTFQPVAEHQPDKQNDERPVNINGDACHPSKFPRPRHPCSLDIPTYG